MERYGAHWEITIVGSLMVSEMLTLFTTLVVYLYPDRVRLWANRRRKTAHPGENMVAVNLHSGA